MSAVQVSTSQVAASSLAANSDSVALQLLVSGVSVATATLCTNPLDVIKVRIQLQKLHGGTKSLGVIGTGSRILADEGWTALWKGVQPSMARGLVYGGLRLGLYGPCKEFLTSARYGSEAGPGADAGAALGMKAAAGALSGGLAAALTSPTELVKTRQQAHASGTKPVLEIIREVVRADGVKALWRGATPGVIRASLLTSSQCATYDEIKRTLLRTTPVTDGAPLHVLVSAITGLVTTTATTPADVIKTLMFSGKPQYRTLLGAAGSLIRESGPRGFFRGWLPNYLRLGPQTIITFVVAEKLREVAGLPKL